MENDRVIECLYDISTDAIYCITTEERKAIQTSIKAIKKLEKIKQIVNESYTEDEFYFVVKDIKEVLEQE